MTSVVATQPRPSVLLRMLGVLRNGIFGTLLCLTPVTAILALGWIARHMAATVEIHRGGTPDRPGWIMGATGQGWLQRLLGGFAANIHAGLKTTLGLFVLTLPFTLAWLGAWWAGWENSFNKGYEQAAVAPIVWAVATFVSLPILTCLPMALAHATTERRWSAFFEWRKIRTITSAATWRILWLALLSLGAVGVFFVLRTVPVFIEGWVPEFSALSATRQAEIAFQLDLLGAACAFGLTAFLRHRAAVIYARAVARLELGVPNRTISSVWFLLACAVWLALPLLIVFGQFLNYDAALWLLHPVLTLPWVG